MQSVVFTLPTQVTTGFSNAAAYDAHRPSYPAEAVSKFLAHLEIASQSNARVVEIGAGTGKFTELLAARDDRFEIIAVEPHQGMRKGLVAKGLKGVKVVDGNADNMPVEEGWGDACIAAQSWHWFATKESLKEISRVLRPGAVLGLIWNIEDYNAPLSWTATTKWEKQLNDIMFSLEDGKARFRHEKWKEVFENQVEMTPFQALKDTFTNNLPTFSLPLGEDTVEWTVWLSEEDLWNRFNTLSQIANLQGEEKQMTRNKMHEICKGDDVERNKDGLLCVHGRTYFAWTSRV